MTAFNKSLPMGKPQGKEEKTLSTGNGVRRKESVGVGDGLSVREGFDSGLAESNPDVNYKEDPVTGMAVERVEPRDAKAVSGKDGKFWLIG